MLLGKSVIGAIPTYLVVVGNLQVFVLQKLHKNVVEAIHRYFVVIGNLY